MLYIRTPYVVGTVTGVYVGLNEPGTVRSRQVPFLDVSLEGIAGDRHYGSQRLSGVRETSLIPKGTLIPNHRQWSAVSVEELNQIAEAMGLQSIDAWLVGANLLLEGVAEFSKLPPLTALVFEGNPPARLIVYQENHPCRYPGDEIAKSTGLDVATKFRPAAEGRRGLVGWAETPGKILIGSKFTVYMPAYADKSVQAPD